MYKTNNKKLNKRSSYPILTLPSHAKLSITDVKVKKDQPPNYITEIIISSANDSTVHGIDHFFKREHPFIKSIWLLLFLMSTGVCIYVISQTVISYLSFETVTKAENIYVDITQFPVIAICSLNPFMTNVSFEFVKNILVDNGLINNSNTEGFKYYFDDVIKTFRFLSGMNALNTNISSEYRKQFGFDIKEVLLSCTFNFKLCSADDFEWYFDLMYGNCYKFNSGKYANGSIAPIRNCTKAGPINGLSIEILTNEPENPMSLSTETGARVIVFNRTHQPVFYEGVLAASGAKTSIEIDRVFSYYLEQPFSDCTRDITQDHPSELVKGILLTGYAYTREICFLACYQRYAIEKCGCFNLYIQMLTGTPNLNETRYETCLNYTHLICDFQALSEFYSMDIGSICGKECPLECDSVVYNLYTSQSEYPSKVYADSLMNNPIIIEKFASNNVSMSYDTLKRAMLQITVFYGNLGYQQFDEKQKYKFEDLVSSIGGTLGLFLGMSFLSFAEILDILLQICFHKTKKRYEL